MKRLRSSEAGFTLIEMLIATALFLLVLSGLATVTAQWLPNWNRGFARVQRTEDLALGLERIAADLAAAEYVPPNGKSTIPLFEGSELSVAFVRTAVGPNAKPGLEIVRLAETSDKNGPVFVRETTPFMPLDVSLASLKFPTSAVLIRPPYRVLFSYAGADQVWRNSWRGDTLLPTAIRVMVRNSASGRSLAYSTAIKIHADAPNGCAAGAGCNVQQTPGVPGAPGVPNSPVLATPQPGMVSAN